MPGLVVKHSEPSWIRYIHQRIRQNKNMLMFVSGPTGSGKSWSSLAIAELLDPTFDITRVVFSGIELMSLINHANLKKGNVIVFEEVGVSLSNRNWQSTINKMLNYLLQTFRHRCIVLIMNAPYMDFADAGTRKLFHAELRTVNINLKDCKVKMKPQLIQYNSRNQKFYYKYLRVVTDKGAIPITAWSIPKPSKELVKSYEVKKRKFTDGLNKEILSELLKAHKKNNRKRKKCLKCGHQWYPRVENPKKCPSCHNDPY